MELAIQYLVFFFQFWGFQRFLLLCDNAQNEFSRFTMKETVQQSHEKMFEAKRMSFIMTNLWNTNSCRTSRKLKKASLMKVRILEKTKKKFPHNFHNFWGKKSPFRKATAEKIWEAHLCTPQRNCICHFHNFCLEDPQGKISFSDFFSKCYSGSSVATHVRVSTTKKTRENH